MDETRKFDPEEVQEQAKAELEQTQAFEPVEEFSLEDIIKEFGGEPAADLEQTQAFEPVEDAQPAPDLEQTQAFQPVEELTETREFTPAEQVDDSTKALPDLSQVEEKPQVTSDTIRLDAIDQAELQVSMVSGAQPIDDEAE